MPTLVYFTGQVIGQANGYDEADDYALQFYDFTPVAAELLPDFLKGLKPCGCLVLEPFTEHKEGEHKPWAYSLTRDGVIAQIFATS